MEGSRLPKRFYIGAVNNLYPHNTIFIPLRCKDSANRKQMQIYLQFAEMQPIFAKQGRKKMKSEEKSTNKEKQTLIIRKYHQYLKLEKALSPNTVDAYQTDLQKLLHFLEGEGIAILTLPWMTWHFASGLHDIGIHPRSQARILSGIKSFFHFLVMADYLEETPTNCWRDPKSDSSFQKY